MAEIETNRLILKRCEESFATIILEYLIKNRDFFKPWIPKQEESFYTLEKQIEILKAKKKSFEEEKELKFYIFKKDDESKIIGELEFSNIIKGAFLSCYLGYKTDKDEINKGYMFEALKSSIEYLFKNIKLHRIEANVIPRNAPSIFLLEKLGFEKEGLSKKYLKINGVWEDHLHFVFLNEQIE
jgi:ribosomal-protein-alanine N-acetyltransferase